MSPNACTTCANPIQAGDRFCGVCGTRIMLQAQDATPTREIPTQVQAPQGTPTRSGNRALVLAAVVGTFLVLAVGGAAMALTGFGPGLLGSSDPQQVNSPGKPAEETSVSAETHPSQTSPEPTPISSVSPDSPPEMAFNELLPTLQERTTAPIMLPAELPSVLKNVALDPDLEGDRYGVVFFREPPEEVVEHWSRGEVYGTLMASPREEVRSNEYFEATSVETIELPDGAEATLRRMEPIREEAGTQGPFWEGKFEEGNHFYVLILLDDTSRDMAAQILSTIVEVPREEEPVDKITKEDTDFSPPPNPIQVAPDLEKAQMVSETDAEEAAGDYYRAAGLENWEYTYDHLDSKTRRMFTKEEWFRKNQWFADNGSVIYHIESVELDVHGR
jgi:hypothetical protein